MTQHALLTSEFDSYVQDAMSTWSVPGLSMAVVKDDAIVMSRSYGLRDIETDAPVDRNTLFAIGSTSKAFTSAALAMLVDGGQLAWSDPVVKHLPDFQMFDPWVTREITVRDLLTHQSGLMRYDFTWYGAERSREEILHRVRYMQPSWSFRSKAQYQNIMYLAAGQIIPAITGQSWDDFVQERIFEPMGMQSSMTSVTGLQGKENTATPYAEIERQVRPIPWRNIDNMAPAGSIISNMVDMAQWLRLQLGQGTYQGQQLLSADRAQEMHAPHFLFHTSEIISGLTQVVGDLGIHFWTCGLGWIVHDFRGRKSSLHQGGIDGMSCFVGLIPEENVGAVILTNLNGSMLPMALLLKVYDACLDAPERDWSADLLPLKTAVEAGEEAQRREIKEARVSGTSPSLPLSSYSGTYEHPVYEELDVVKGNGKLMARFDPTLICDLEHWHHDTFQLTWPDAILGKTYVTFGLGRDGQVERLLIDALVDGSSATYNRLSDS